MTPNTNNDEFQDLSAHEVVFTLNEAGGAAHLTAAQQATRACAALATMAARAGNDERYADIIDAGAIEEVVSCIDTHGMDDFVALHGLTALHALTRHSTRLTAFLVECGAYPSTLRCIPYHVGDQAIGELCSLVLLGLSEVDDDKVRQLWAHHDALEQLCYTAFNVRQPRSAAIAVNVCTLLSRMLSVAPTDATPLSSFVLLLAEFVRVHFANPVVVVAALRVLVAFGEAADGALRGALGASAEAVLQAVTLVLGKTYSYLTRPATWDAETSLRDDATAAASGAALSADHHAIVSASLRIFYLVASGLRAVPPAQRALCTPSGAPIAPDINYVKMGSPSATSAVSAEHRLLLAVTHPDVLPLYTVVVTFIRLHVFKATDAGEGADDLSAACVDACRALTCVLQSLDPGVVNARHIFRVKASLDDQNVPALLHTMLSQQGQADQTVFAAANTRADIDHAVRELLDSLT
jgi:hypothetical protein